VSVTRQKEAFLHGDFVPLFADILYAFFMCRKPPDSGCERVGIDVLIADV
jgi:hypothetical protein